MTQSRNLPLPEGDLHAWASALVQVLQAESIVTISDIKETTPPVLPINDSNGNPLVTEDGVYLYEPGLGQPFVSPFTVEIDTQHLVDAAITTAKLAGLSVDRDKLANLSVDAAKLADSSVETQKIANAAVGAAAIAAAAIGTLQVANAAITTGKIADLAVTSAKILSLDAEKITAGTITSDKFTSALYGNISQLFEFLDRLQGGADDYQNSLTKTETEGADHTQTNGHVFYDIDPGGRPAFQIATQAKYDSGITYDSTVTWDFPTFASGVVLYTEDLGAENTIQIGLVFKEYIDTNTGVTVKARYSLNGTNYGTNSPNLDDNAFETLSISELEPNLYFAKGRLFTFQYVQFRIELSTTDQNGFSVLTELEVLGNVVQRYDTLADIDIGSTGSTVNFSGFEAPPALVVQPKGNTPLTPLVEDNVTTSAATIHLYDNSGVEVAGTVDVILVGE